MFTSKLFAEMTVKLKVIFGKWVLFGPFFSLHKPAWCIYGNWVLMKENHNNEELSLNLIEYPGRIWLCWDPLGKTMLSPEENNIFSWRELYFLPKQDYVKLRKLIEFIKFTFTEYDN